jgi:CRISPR-associated endonuclease/helicase Cas3
MLFSCLIDADRLDTAAHAAELPSQFPPLDADSLLDRLLQAIQKRADAVEEGPVKLARNQVLQAALLAAERPGPLFSLTVPTGGAKTLASMAFALRRAALNPQRVRRIIVVVPFLSIIEQNAKVYRDALGADVILEHHSNAWGDGNGDSNDPMDYSHPARQLAAENWNAPIVITTAVRFFESLFSNRPRGLRRMHNVARSVVILDEVQTVPREFVSPILAMIQALAKDWGTTFVFSTATQPAFERRTLSAPPDGRLNAGTLDEMIPNPAHLFSILRRVNVEWPQSGSTMTWDAVADELRDEAQALVIVNTRKHARQLFHLLESSDTLHLSNSMCSKHRLKILAEIRERLANGVPCRVVSTQLVEAGVDLDFPVVWRAMAPLESIAQAAGRCDREGKLTKRAGKPGGRVVVFIPEDARTPPGAYKEATERTATLASCGLVQIDDPESIRRYYEEFYKGSLDPMGIEDSRKRWNFKTIAEQFRLIDDLSKPVVVPYDDQAQDLLQSLRFGAASLRVLRQLQSYTVNLWEHEFREAANRGILVRVAEDREIWRCPEGLYDERIGIKLDPETFVF